MKFSNKLILALILLAHYPIRADPVMFSQEPVKHSRIVYNDDGTINKIIMPDGRELPGGSGTICSTGCEPIGVESLEKDKDRKWLIAIPIIAGVIVCAKLCGNNPPGIPPTTSPPIVPPGIPPAEVPEPTTLLLLGTGLVGVIKMIRRKGE